MKQELACKRLRRFLQNALRHYMLSTCGRYTKLVKEKLGTDILDTSWPIAFVFIMGTVGMTQEWVLKDNTYRRKQWSG